MLSHDNLGDVHYWQMSRTYLGRSLYKTGFFYLDGILIDTGPTNLQRDLAKLFNELKVEKAFITHHHEDHTGNAALLAQRGVELFAHQGSSDLLAEVAGEIPFYRRVVWGTPQPAKFQNMPADVKTRLFQLQVIPTPGHSPDHLCLFEPENRWIFTGDLYLSSYLRYLRDDEDIYELMRSLRKLIDLKPSIVCCSHRGFIPEGEKALAKKLSFLEELQNTVLKAHEKGESLEHLASRMFKMDRFRWFSQGEFSTINLMNAFLRQ